MAQHRNKRSRDLADMLGVPEAALLAAQTGPEVVRIDARPDRLIPAVRTLGEVLALTRNASCVHERTGTYEDWHPGDHAAMVLGSEIDLRIFPAHWVHGFAMTGRRPSLQVFDAAGDAVHKVHFRDGSDRAAFDRLVAALALDAQPDTIALAPRAAPEGARANPDRAADLRARWAGLTDTHQFLGLVRKLKMTRLGAYRTVGAPMATPLAPQAVTDLLHGAALAGVEVMLFVGNTGCIQIHGGPIEKIVPTGPWINVLDPRFNLHLRTDHIAEVWRVDKPTRHGPALSVEAFDHDGQLILQVFGKRGAGLPAWEALAHSLPAPEAVAP
ncbi:hemin-degrading factor [Rhodobaculum claviforme]|uniref:Hemin-degrading factor n=2 Tax=Rhodobaculum claviforme TaxID=1549854 RepID=A0A934TH78_9RHOB|nr:hemin-degrading factor [Rhodobaculum claviforme]